MIAMTCIASLLLQFASPVSRSGIPPDALPEVVEEHRRPPLARGL